MGGVFMEVEISEMLENFLLVIAGFTCGLLASIAGLTSFMSIKGGKNGSQNGSK